MKTPSIQLNPVCPQNHRPTFVVVFFVVSYSSSLAPIPLLSLYRTTVQCAPSPPQLTSPSHHFLDLYFQFLISQRPCSTHAQNKKKINYLCFTVLFVLCGGGVGLITLCPMTWHVSEHTVSSYVVLERDGEGRLDRSCER